MENEDDNHGYFHSTQLSYHPKIVQTTKNPALERMRNNIKISLFNQNEPPRYEENQNGEIEQDCIMKKENQNGNLADACSIKNGQFDMKDDIEVTQKAHSAGKNPLLEKMRNKIKSTLFNQVEEKNNILENCNNQHLNTCNFELKKIDEKEDITPQETDTNNSISDSDHDSDSDSFSSNDQHDNNLITQNEVASIETFSESTDNEDKKPNSLTYLPKVDFSKKKLHRTASSGDISEKKNIDKRIFYNYDKNLTPKQLLEEIDEEEDPDIHFLKNEKEFEVYYVMTDHLGEGTTGRVEKCYKVLDNKHYAVKIIDYKGDMEVLKMILKEFKNHKKLSHKNIVKVYEMYVDANRQTIYTILELAECREMFDVIHELGSYSEAVASSIFKQIATAIHYMHSKGVCHRDLKPNNILVSNDGTIVKITDFNVSKFIDNTNQRFKSLSNELFKMWTYTGTVAFIAPEVFLDTEYTPAVDMWSAGVILYTMLCGYQPFQAEYLQDLIELIKEGKYEFHPDPWDKISKEAKDLVKKCLTKDPIKRYDPWEALTHPWHTKLSKSYIPDTVNNLKRHLRRNTRVNKALFGSNLSGSFIKRDRSSTFTLMPYKTPSRFSLPMIDTLHLLNKSKEENKESTKLNPLMLRSQEDYMKGQSYGPEMSWNLLENYDIDRKFSTDIKEFGSNLSVSSNSNNSPPLSHKEKEEALLQK